MKPTRTKHVIIATQDNPIPGTSLVNRRYFFLCGKTRDVTTKAGSSIKQWWRDDAGVCALCGKLQK